MTFQFENLKCELYYNNSLLDYIINVPEKNLKLSFNRIDNFMETGNPQNIGVNDNNQPCQIYELNSYIYLGCISVVKDSFLKQYKLIKRLKQKQNG